MDRLGRYEILGELGRGGMGVVYRARREGTSFDVALKVIAAGEDASPEAVARFQREARIATELDHPAIVRVLDAGEEAGAAWFAMECIEGPSLDRLINEREFEWREAVTLVRDVADAVAVAHARGVLHRDIKPSNILMDGDGKPHLTDFGLAKDTRTESKYTRTGQTLGTPAYMSPEQARGELTDLTPASDVWSLGCVLYELLANQAPFTGDTPAAVVAHVVGGSPEPLRRAAPGLPRPVYTLVAACLAKSPRHRPAHAGALRDDLERVLQGGRPHHRPPRRWAPWALAASAALLLSAGLIPAFREPPPAPPPKHDPRAAQLAQRGWESRHREPAEAVQLLHEALQLEPGRDEWRVQLGMAEWLRGDVESAMAAWAAVPAESPHSSDARWLEGLAMYTGEETDARARAERSSEYWAVAAAQEGSGARWATAGLALAHEQLDLLDTHLEGATGWQASILRALGQFAGRGLGRPIDPKIVNRELDRVLAAGMTFGWVLLNRGVARGMLGDLDGAEEDYRAALATRPDDALLRFNLANIAKERGEFAEAVDGYTRALELQPGYRDAHAERALARVRLGDDEGALRDFTAELARNPLHVRALAHRADIYTRRGRVSEALADLDHALTIEPGHIQSLRVRASLYGRAGRHAACMRDCDHVLRLLPDDPDALNLRAAARSATGDWEGALADLNRAVEVHPTHAPSLINRAAWNIDRGDPAAAIADLSRAIESSPHLPSAYRNRAVAYLRLRKWKEARDDYDRVVQRRPRDYGARAGRGNMRIQLGDRAGAIADWRQALADAPPDWQGAESVRRNLRLATTGKK